jgi:hypothetical protein
MILTKIKLITLIIGFVLLFAGFFGLTKTNLDFKLQNLSVSQAFNIFEAFKINEQRPQNGDRPPIVMDRTQSGQLEYEFGFWWEKGKQTKVVIQDTACIQLAFLNDEEVYFKPDEDIKLQEVTDSAKPIVGKKAERSMVDSCDKRQNTELELSKKLVLGNNKLKLVFSRANMAILNLNGSFKDSQFIIYYLAILIGAIFVLNSALLFFKFNLFYRISIILALVLRFLYFYNTPPYLREDDAIGHIEYINLLASGKNPLPDSCWQCYHQPFYHGFMGIFRNWWVNSGFEIIAKWEVAVQGLSLVLSIFTLIVSAKILQMVIKKIDWDNSLPSRLLQYTPIFVLSTWSATTQNSVKLNSDSWVHLFSVLGIYFILKWWTQMSLKYLVIATIFGFFASISKTTGLSVLFVITGLFLLKYLRTGNYKWQNILRLISKYVVSISCIVFFLILSVFFIGYRSSLSNGVNKLVPNAQFSDRIFVVENNIQDIFLLDIFRFATGVRDGIDSPILWHQLIRTMTVSQATTFETLLNRNLISSIYILTLALIIMSFLSYFKVRNKYFIPLYCIFLLYITNLIITRFISPVVHTVHIRYIFPITVIMAVIPSFYINEIKNRKIKFLLVFLIILFCILNTFVNISFFINNSFLL